jgi:hypothetical protein
VVIGVALQFEEEIICEAMGSIPTVENSHLFVFTVGEFFPRKAVVFDVVYGFEVKDRSEGHERVDDHGLHSKDKIDQSCVPEASRHTPNCIIGKESLPIAFLVLIHSLQRIDNA